MTPKLNGAKNHPQQVAKRPSIDRLFDAASPTDEVDDRGTPQSLFDELNREFHFTIDVAASALNTKCERFYDLSSNGLIQDWSGETVWCNPPYSDLPSWVAKAHHEVNATTVMLIPANRTEQPFWQTYIEPHRDGGGRLRSRYPKGRVRFVKDGETMATPTWPSCLLVWKYVSSTDG